ncbi:hypothetical protein Y1Q_0021237 [Alligator mississippiensis]|uniref:Integrase catalytic domain-containing protein n=1 Tax=Alligator mississippiensis TaxID=8496 RepID=A0A151MS90_ALLMI|nr:hypothetical protein Y1Q_0021237 [Alligator mississippiensis]
MGPLPKSHRGYQYVLVLVDYAMRFLDAVQLQSTMATSEAEELLKWITREDSEKPVYLRYSEQDKTIMEDNHPQL